MSKLKAGRSCVRALAALLSLGVVFAGPSARSAERVYEISLRPTPEGLERTFSGWDDYDDVSLDEPSGGKTTPNGRLPDDELADLAKLYRERLSQPQELRQKFRGVFAERMPADVGGHGRYLNHASPLGKSYAYVERFRGGDDIDLALFGRRAAVDTCVDILRDWIDAEVAGSPRRAEVRRFFHQELRQDLRKLSLVPLNEAGAAARNGQSLTGRLEETAIIEELVNRVLQYGLERDYFDADDFADLRLLLLDDDAPKDEQDFVRIFSKSIARKTGLDPASADRLAKLFGDDDRVEASLSDAIRKHPEFKSYAERTARNSDGTSDAEPMAFFDELMQKAFLFDWFEEAIRLELTLEAPVKPFSTNGESDPSRGATIRWTRYVDDQGMPTLCYAYWSVPAEAFQRKHFGKVAVDGSTLAGAASLFNRLSPKLQAELTRHLESLEPGDALRGRVTEFQFLEPADDEAKAVVGRLLELLSDQL